MIINMTFTGKPLKNAITKVKTLIDQLLLHPDVHFGNKFVLKTLLDCESTDLMKYWIQTNTNDNPDSIFDLVTAINKHFGLDSIICSLSDTDVITVMNTLPASESDYTDTTMANDIAVVPVTTTNDAAYDSLEEVDLDPATAAMLEIGPDLISDDNNALKEFEIIDDFMDKKTSKYPSDNDEFSTVTNGYVRG